MRTTEIFFALPFNVSDGTSLQPGYYILEI
jgi:hypothetical protein